VMERILYDISFTAPDRDGEAVVIDGEHVARDLGELAQNVDLSRFVL